VRHHQPSSERARWPGHRAAARGARRNEAYLVTEASESRSAEIGQRERRYLVMMGIRVVCFVITVVLFLTHAGWVTVIPAFGAIALPYFAVVVANSRRPTASSGFRPYQPNLPERYVPPRGESGSGTPGSGTPGSGTPGSGTPGSGTPGSGESGNGTSDTGTSGSGTP
jgi:hypothetical protein